MFSKTLYKQYEFKNKWTDKYEGVIECGLTAIHRGVIREDLILFFQRLFGHLNFLNTIIKPNGN